MKPMIYILGIWYIIYNTNNGNNNYLTKYENNNIYSKMLILFRSLLNFNEI